MIIDKPHEGIVNYINEGVVKLARTFNANVQYLDYENFDEIKKVCDDFVTLKASYARIDQLYGR